ncbi:hypothetical protein AVEN_198321-1 [Araneus ventricosus]|uniref:Uncharacterized protein n=1 Tax=Araneus ventricosus TaxID=182803 RepID=A0A4Y2JW91_ARAVE|nr:hypothetical protein AVEN_198321-1 [Araneus ventricosus]
MSQNDTFVSNTAEHQSSLNDNDNNGKTTTRLFCSCYKFNINGSQEEIDFTISRPSEMFKELKILNDKIHALLSDDEFELDIIECADFENETKLTIFKSRKTLENFKVPNIDPTPDAAILPNEELDEHVILSLSFILRQRYFAKCTYDLHSIHYKITYNENRAL